MHRPTRRVLVACALTVLVGFPLAVSAQTRDLDIRTFQVRAEITGALAVVTLDMVFVNYTSQAMEFTGRLALPEDAAVSDLALWVGGLRSPGELLPRVTAERIYREITQQRRDPALLTYLGPGRWGLSVSPIPANGTQKVQVIYTHLLRPHEGALEFRGPSLDRKAQEMDFSAEVREGIKDIKPLRGALGVQRTAEGLRLGVRKEPASLADPVEFACTFEGKAPEVFWHRSDRDGWRFVAMLPEPPSLADVKPRPRDYVLIVDASESMGKRLETCRKAAYEILDLLKPEDRLAIVAVSSDVRVWKEKFTPADKPALDDARAFLKGLKAEGGTDLAAGLRAAGSYNTLGKAWLDVILMTDECDRVGTLSEDGKPEPAPRTATTAPAPTTMPSRPPPNCRLYALNLGHGLGSPISSMECSLWEPREMEEMLDFTRFVRMSDLTLALADGTDPAPFHLTKAILTDSETNTRHILLAGQWPDNRDKPLELTISAILDLKEHQAKATIQPPDPKGQGTAYPGGAGFGRVWAHLRAIQTWQDLQDEKARMTDLEKLIAFSKAWHIATPATAFLVLETDGDYVRRGIRRDLSSVKVGQGFAEQAHLFAHETQGQGETADNDRGRALRSQANDLLRLGSLVEAIGVYQKMAADMIATFDDQRRLTLLQQFAALQASVQDEHAQKRQEQEAAAAAPPWEQVFQLPIPIDLVPLPESPRTVLPITPVSLPGNPAVWKKLQVRLPKVDFTNLEAKDVMEYFKTAMGANFRANWPALLAAGVDRTAPVTLSLTDVTVQQAMQEVLKNLGTVTPLSFAVDDIGVMVSTKDDLTKTPITRIYDVRDLVSRMPIGRPERQSYSGTSASGGPFGESISSSFGGEESLSSRRDAVTRITDALREALSKGDSSSPFTEPSFPAPSAPVRIYNVRDLEVRVPSFAGPSRSNWSSNSGEENRVTRCEGITQLTDTLRQTIDKDSWAPTGTIGSIRELNGLLIVTQTVENHTALANLLNTLKQGMKDVRPQVASSVEPPPPESLFTNNGCIQPWVADLLDRAARGKLSKFSSVQVRHVADRKFASIGGYWLDVTLTTSHRIVLVSPASAAMIELAKRRPGVDKAAGLGPYVVVAVGPEAAISPNPSGLASLQEPEVKRLLDTIKG